MIRVLLAILALLVATPAFAQLEEQAARQIQLARDDFEAGHYERAVNSASSALRLDPLLYDALVIKALAYEKLNEPMLAYSLLVTYQELTRGMTQSPEVAPALERLKKLIRGVIDQPLPATTPAPTPPEAEAEAPVIAFEILSRRNQRDLFDQMNKALDAGPAHISFRSQSPTKGDDFLFGLASARWDGNELDIDDRSFLVILDSEKLVTKARGGATLDFPAEEAEHDVHLWFDGDRIALRVDGEAIGPFQTHDLPRDASWMIQLDDDARAWNLTARPWTGNFARGIPSGTDGASREATELVSSQVTLSGRIDEESDRDRIAEQLPDVVEAAVLRVGFTVHCSRKGYVIVRPGDGREVTVGREIDVRGATRLPRVRNGLACRGGAEQVELVFQADGSVAGVVGDREFGPLFPGRPTGGGEPSFRVKGDPEDIHVEGVVYEVATRKAGRRVFRAGRPD